MKRMSPFHLQAVPGKVSAQAVLKSLLILNMVFTGRFLSAQDGKQPDPEYLGQRIQAAADLERIGRYDAAGLIYETLYGEYPGHPVVFSRYKEFCLSAGRYELALTLIDRRLEERPGDLSLEVERGRVLFRMGDEEKARKQWGEILERYSSRQSVYQTVAAAMTTERLYQDAIQVYLQGRKRLGRPDLFVYQVANLYAAEIQYDKAVEELVSWLEARPDQAPVIENYLMKYPKTDKVTGFMIRRISRALERYPDSNPMRRLFAHVLLTAGEGAEALNEIRKIEKKASAGEQGNVLFFFGQRAQEAGAVETAVEAFGELLKTVPDYRGRDQVFYALGNAERSLSNWKDAIRFYVRISTETPKSPLASRALLEAARSSMDGLHAIAEAETLFTRILMQYPERPEYREAQLDLARCRMLQGNFTDADSLYALILKAEEARRERGTLWIRSLTGRAENRFFDGDFAGALQLLETIGEEPLSSEAFQDARMNEALRLKMLIQEYQGTRPGALRRLARARLRQRQYRTDEAVSELDTLVKTWPREPIAAEALLDLGVLRIQHRQWEPALSALDTLLSRFPGKVFADQALERSGFILEQLHRPSAAMDRYERLLILYPASPLQDQVRRRIRVLESRNGS